MYKKFAIGICFVCVFMALAFSVVYCIIMYGRFEVTSVYHPFRFVWVKYFNFRMEIMCLNKCFGPQPIELGVFEVICVSQRIYVKTLWNSNLGIPQKNRGLEETY